MEQQQPRSQADTKYEFWLRLFKQYMPYVIILALSYAYDSKDKKCDKLHEAIELKQQQTIERQDQTIETFRKMKENDNELFKTLLKDVK